MCITFFLSLSLWCSTWEAKWCLHLLCSLLWQGKNIYVYTSSVKPFLILQVRALFPGWNAWCYTLSACLSSTPDKLSVLGAFIHVAQVLVVLWSSLLVNSWRLLGPGRGRRDGGVTCCDLTTHLHHLGDLYLNGHGSWDVIENLRLEALTSDRLLPADVPVYWNPRWRLKNNPIYC